MGRTCNRKLQANHYMLPYNSASVLIFVSICWLDLDLSGILCCSKISVILFIVSKLFFKTEVGRICCSQVCGPHLDENQVRSIVDEIKQVLTASSTRKHERAERAKEEDFDAEERELLKEENEQEEDLFDQVCSVIGFGDLNHLIKCFSVCCPDTYLRIIQRNL